MKILFLTENEDGPSTRYRVRQFLPELEARGGEVTVSVVPDDRTARRALFAAAADHDRVVVQRRLVHPFDVRALRRSARSLIFDFDDAIQFPDSMSRKRRSWSRWLKFLSIATSADHVIAGSRHLEKLAREYNRNVTVVPTVVDRSLYAADVKITDEDNDAGGAQDPAVAATLVWIGSRSTLPFLEDIVPAIEEAARAVGPLRLRVIADAAPRSRTRDLIIEHVAWSSSTEAKELARADIGLAPLRADRWCHGKCGLRLLQFFAAGVASVASPIGAQSDILAAGCAEAATDPDEFTASIVALVRNPERRRDLAAAGRRRQRDEYDLSVWGERFADVVLDGLARPAAEPDAGEAGEAVSGGSADASPTVRGESRS